MAGRSIEERLVEILRGSLDDLIRELGANVTMTTEIHADAPKDRQGEPYRIAARIGFGNDDFQGALTLVGEPQVFARLFPNFPGVPIEPTDLVDWARELANLTVGRFKNRAGARGVDVAIECPFSVSSEQAASLAKWGPRPTPLTVEIEGMRLQTRISFDIFGPVALSSDPLPDRETGPVEGDILLF